MTVRRDPRILLRNIVKAAAKIENYIDSVDLATYVGDEGIQDQLERNFISIGEALNQLSRDAPDLAGRFPEVGDIIGFRHVLVHDYDQIEAETVWSCAVDELPGIRLIAEMLLTEVNTPSHEDDGEDTTPGPNEIPTEPTPP